MSEAIRRALEKLERANGVLLEISGSEYERQVYVKFGENEKHYVAEFSAIPNDEYVASMIENKEGYISGKIREFARTFPARLEKARALYETKYGKYEAQPKDDYH